MTNAHCLRQRCRLGEATESICAPRPETLPGLELDDRGIEPERAACEQQDAPDKEPPSAPTTGAWCWGMLLRRSRVHAGILTYSAQTNYGTITPRNHPS